MGRVYLGIDPGSKGFIAINNCGDIKYLPLSDKDFYKVSDFLKQTKEEYDDVVCVMEEVHAIFGSSAKGTFSFGEINGLLKGLLIANKIPYHLVPPKTWQKEIWSNKDIVYDYKKPTAKASNRKVINTKATSFNAAKRLFPLEDLRRTTACKNIDDNKVDALLISEYGRRKNL